MAKVFFFVQLCSNTFVASSTLTSNVIALPSPSNVDLCESDLKQVRFLSKGDVLDRDQGPVRAALDGSILILDGVQNAEQNILPVLNNLLENREIGCDDGSFLIPAAKYDTLGKEEIQKNKFRRVSADFRVIALGVPVPPFDGLLLDPPFRSRFQAKAVDYGKLGRACKNLYLEQYSSASESLFGTGNYWFPQPAVRRTANLQKFFGKSCGTLDWVFPTIYYWCQLQQNSSKAVREHLLQAVERACRFSLRISGVTRNDASTGTVHFINTDTSESFDATTSLGEVPLAKLAGDGFYDPSWTEGQVKAFTRAVCMHVAGSDFCFLGDSGTGKSMLAKAFARAFGYSFRVLPVYKDMVASQLLQTVGTDFSGKNSVYYDSELVAAAKSGQLLIIDCFEELPSGATCMLESLVHQRYCQLPDGRLLTEADVHPSFRVVALHTTRPLAAGDGLINWLAPEKLNLFLWSSLPSFSELELYKICGSHTSKEAFESLGLFLRNLKAHAVINYLHDRFSFRVLQRILTKATSSRNTTWRKRLSSFIFSVCMGPFIPLQHQSALVSVLDRSGIPFIVERSDFPIRKMPGRVLFGDIDLAVFLPSSEADASDGALIPKVTYFENKVQNSLLRDMAIDWQLHENLLLVGNQGVGKNKVVDVFLQLLSRPRVYMQLSRDTTVGALTLRPTLKAGRLVYQESPLVLAARRGYVLVLDEVDKAPPSVLASLKSFIKDRYLLLPNGKYISEEAFARRSLPVSASTNKDSVSEFIAEAHIRLHPDFRIILLGNRPGRGFHGSDFIKVVGDCFSVHCATALDIDSERSLLFQRFPECPQIVINQLTLIFEELRSLNTSEMGMLYPYSTRELLGVLTHYTAASSPTRGNISSALANTFDFEAFDTSLYETLSRVCKRYGVNLSADEASNVVEASMERRALLDKDLRVVSRGLLKRKSQTVEFRAPQRVGSWQVAVNKSTGNYSTLCTNYRSESMSPLCCEVLIKCPELGCLTIAAVGEPFSIAGASKFTFYPLLVRQSLELIILQLEKTSADLSLYDGAVIFTVALASYFPKLKARGLAVENRTSPTYLHFKSQKLNGETTALASVEGDNERDNDDENMDDLILCSGTQSGKLCNYLLISTKDDRMLSLNIVIPTSLSLRNPNDSFSAVNVECYNLESLFDVARGCREKYRATVSLASDRLLISCKNRVALLRLKDLPAVTPVAVFQHSVSALQSIDNGTRSGAFVTFEDTLEVAFLPLSVNSCAVELITACEILPNSALTKSDLAGLCCKYGLVALDSVSYLSLAVVNLGKEVVFLLEFAKTKWTLRTSATNDELASLQKLLANRVTFKRVVDASAVFCADAYCNVDEPFVDFYRVDTKSLTLSKYRHRLRKSVAVDAEMSRNCYVVLEPSSGSDTGRATLVNSDGTVVLVQLNDAAIEREKTLWKQLLMPHTLPNGPNILQNLPAPLAANSKGVTKSKLDALLEAPKREPSGPVNLSAFQLRDGKDAEHLKEIGDSEQRELHRTFMEARFAELELSREDFEKYSHMARRVSHLSSAVRVTLCSERIHSAFESASRGWMYRQLQGEVDETRFGQMVAGESAVFKRRANLEESTSCKSRPPKRLVVSFDLSASMHKFNGHDGRLDRSLECCLMFLEALKGLEKEWSFALLGHSGDTGSLPLLEPPSCPKTMKEQFKVLQKMEQHSAYCLSGDHTVEAISRSFDFLLYGRKKDDRPLNAIESPLYLSLTLSDANLEQYKISGKEIRDTLEKMKQLAQAQSLNFYAVVVFIGTIGRQAEVLVQEIPNHAYTCYDSGELPTLIQRILNSVLKSAPSKL